MIDIREFRADNIVMSVYGFPLKIKKINSEENTIDVVMSPTSIRLPDKPPLTYKAIEVHPIPFTTEWAERFGLIGKIINGLCISQSEYQGHEYDLCLYDEHTWDSERRVICPIYYVHQCQNIFLDLAGHIIE